MIQKLETKPIDMGNKLEDYDAYFVIDPMEKANQKMIYTEEELKDLEDDSFIQD